METTLCVFVKLDTRDLAEKLVKRESETGERNGYDSRVKQSVVRANVTKLRPLLSGANGLVRTERQNCTSRRDGGTHVLIRTFCKHKTTADTHGTTARVVFSFIGYIRERIPR